MQWFIKTNAMFPEAEMKFTAEVEIHFEVIKIEYSCFIDWSVHNLRIRQTCICVGENITRTSLIFPGWCGSGSTSCFWFPIAAFPLHDSQLQLTIYSCQITSAQKTLRRSHFAVWWAMLYSVCSSALSREGMIITSQPHLHMHKHKSVK